MASSSGISVLTSKKANILHDEIKKPGRRSFIGLEYVIEISDMDGEKTLFFCGVCSKILTSTDIFANLYSNQHTVKYLNVFFPTIMKILDAFPKFMIDIKYREVVLNDVVSLIEKKFGVSEPSCFDLYEYLYKKPTIIDEINTKNHPNEALWPECVEEILYKLKTNLEKVLAAEADASDDSDEGYIYRRRRKPETRQNFYENFFTDLPIALNAEALKQHIAKDQKIMMTKEKSLFDRRAEMMIFESELESFAKKPEECPYFHDIWMHFWITLKLEFQDNDVDIRNFDYEEIWKTFWDQKLKEFFVTKFKLNISDYNDESIISSLVFKSEVTEYVKRKMVIEKMKIIQARTISKAREMEWDSQSKTRTKHPTTFKAFIDSLNFEDPLSNFYRKEFNKNLSLLKVCRFLMCLKPELGYTGIALAELFRKCLALEKVHPLRDLSNELYFYHPSRSIIEAARDKLKGIYSLRIISSRKLAAVKKGLDIIENFQKEIEHKKCELEADDFNDILYKALKMEPDIPNPPPAPRITKKSE